MSLGLLLVEGASGFDKRRMSLEY